MYLLPSSVLEVRNSVIKFLLYSCNFNDQQVIIQTAWLHFSNPHPIYQMSTTLFPIQCNRGLIFIKPSIILPFLRVYIYIIHRFIYICACVCVKYRTQKFWSLQCTPESPQVGWFILSIIAEDTRVSCSYRVWIIVWENVYLQIHKYNYGGVPHRYW